MLPWFKPNQKSTPFINAHTILQLLIVLYAFLLPFSYAFTIHTGPYLLLLFWLLDGNIPKKLHALMHEPLFIAFGIFVTIQTLSLFWSSNLDEGIRTLKAYYAIFLTSSIMCTALKPTTRSLAIHAFLLAIVLNVIVSYGLYFGWWHLEHTAPNDPSPWMHHVFYSIFLAISVFLLLEHLFSTSKRWAKPLYAAILILIVINLFINGGRTGQVALLLAFFIFALVYYGTSFKIIFSTLLSLLAISFLFYHTSPIFHDRVDQAISDIQKILQGDLNTSWGLRVAMKQVAIQLIPEHPIIGAGIGDAIDFFRDRLNQTPMAKYIFLQNMQHVHDQYLQILLQTGLLGFGAFIMLLFFLLKKRFHTKLQHAAFLATFCIFLFSFLTDVPLRSFTAGLFGFLVGIFCHLSLRKKEALS